jgi:hypothetical protein
MNDVNPKKVGRMAKYAVATALAILAFVAFGISNEGFCFTQWRFLNDRELIEVTVRTLAEQGQMAIDSSPSSVKEFLNRNPDCCAVDRHPAWRTWLDVMTGWNTLEVEVNFEMNPKRDYSLGENYYKRWISVSACGKFLKYGPGTTTRTLETVGKTTH